MVSPMAEETANRLAVREVVSVAQDLLDVLHASNDGDEGAQIETGARMLLSASRSDSDDIELQMRGPVLSFPDVNYSRSVSCCSAFLIWFTCASALVDTANYF